MNGLKGDLRDALRSLRRTPAFALLVILTLALGVGATAAIFSVVNAVLLRPLPFKNPEGLVRVYHTHPDSPGGIQALSQADMFALRDRSASFETVGTYRVQDPLTGTLTVVEGDRPEAVYVTWVTADFFNVLGVSPLVGRTFERADERPGSPLQAVASYDFWQRRLHGDPHVVGRPLNLAGLSIPVIGVMPRGFWFPRGDRAELWLIDRMTPPTRQGPWWFNTIARLRPGATDAQARADLNAAATHVRTTAPNGSADWTLVMRPLKSELLGDMNQVLLLLLAAVGLLLAIVCVNVMNLFLARATERRRDIAVRLALGASRGRIIRLLLAETFMLAPAGAIVGLSLARCGVTALIRVTPENLQLLRDANIGTDWRVVVLTAVIAVTCSLIFGLAPALAGSGWRLNGVLNESGNRTTDTRANRRLRGALVVAQITLAVPLVIGAGLVTRSLIELRHVDAGVRPDRVLTATMTVRSGRPQFFDRVLAAVRSLPGIDAATLADGLPPNSLPDVSSFIVDGQPVPNGKPEPVAGFLNVDGEYFQTLGIPLLRGRTFDSRDTSPGARNVVIVNEALVRRSFVNRDPIGQRLRVAGTWVATIVGVAGNVKYRGLDAAEELTIYGAAHTARRRSMHLIVRTTGDPVAATPALRRLVAAVDPEVPLARTRTLEQLMDESVARPRFRTTLLALFAVAALALAAIGIYGLMMYAVSQRTREMGIRMALGARPADVRNMVITEGLTLALTGVALGIVGALALTQVMTNLLFGVSATDPATFVGVALLLIGVALGACWLPARLATRSDPILALRSE